MITSEHRRTGAQTRAAILEAAAVAFRDRGYDSATLEGIAVQLGITRAAILHHFASKAQMLEEIVVPFLADLDRLFDATESAAPLTARRRRAFLIAFVDVLCRHRPVATLLRNDITAHGHLGPELQLSTRAARMVDVVTGPSPTHADRVRALSALGAILRPVAGPEGELDFTHPETRPVIIEAALAALRSGR